MADVRADRRGLRRHARYVKYTQDVSIINQISRTSPVAMIAKT